MSAKPRFKVGQIVRFRTHENDTRHYARVLKNFDKGWMQVNWGGIICPLPENRAYPLTKKEAGHVQR